MPGAMCLKPQKTAVQTAILIPMMPGTADREYDPDKKRYLGYQYDAGGNLTEVRSYPAGAEGGPEGTETVRKRFAYDSAWKDQLASVTMEGKTRNFTYDANGNLLSDGKQVYQCG